MKRFVILGSLFALAACASPSSKEEPQAGTDQDWVVKETFDTAYGIVQGIDYLPFQYKEDGCYARALYMSMELAAQGLESNAVFAFAKPGTWLQVGDIRWSYHVAPMLEVGASAHHLTHMVIDPALADTPLTQTQWVGLMGFGPGGHGGPAPTMLFVPGSDYAPDEAKADVANANHDTPDFTSLPPFKQSDVQSACNVMWNYIAWEPDSPDATIQTKQAKLLSRTPDLLSALAGAGKLTEDAPFTLDGCQRPMDP
jgi:hypothetical protein